MHRQRLEHSSVYNIVKLAEEIINQQAFVIIIRLSIVNDSLFVCLGGKYQTLALKCARDVALALKTDATNCLARGCSIK